MNSGVLEKEAEDHIAALSKLDPERPQCKEYVGTLTRATVMSIRIGIQNTKITRINVILLMGLMLISFKDEALRLVSLFANIL